jgi:hypothetical protein
MIKQKWECHKTVEAFKITAVESMATLDGASRYTMIGASGQGEVVDLAWLDKHVPKSKPLHPRSFIGGYFVRYADGYTSWSPADAFEQGYTELKGDTGS